MENDIEHIKKAVDRLVDRFDKHIDSTEDKFQRLDSKYASKMIERLFWSTLATLSAAGMVTLITLV